MLVGCKNDTDYSVDKNDSKIYTSFEKIESSHSNIDFINKITPSFDNKANLFDYDYFYNGSGVGVADFNNDGNIDIVGNTDQELFWLDNKGNGSWDKKLINENIITSDYSAVNFDGDDDLDLLTVSGYNGDITWYQNDGIGNWSEIKF